MFVSDIFHGLYGSVSYLIQSLLNGVLGMLRAFLRSLSRLFQKNWDNRFFTPSLRNPFYLWQLIISSIGIFLKNNFSSNKQIIVSYPTKVLLCCTSFVLTILKVACCFDRHSKGLDMICSSWCKVLNPPVFPQYCPYLTSNYLYEVSQRIQYVHTLQSYTIRSFLLLLLYLLNPILDLLQVKLILIFVIEGVNFALPLTQPVKVEPHVS